MEGEQVVVSMEKPMELDSVQIADQIVDIFLDGVIRDQQNKMVE